MKQIRIARVDGLTLPDGPRYECEWMEGSQMNRWLLKLRLDEAQAAHGPGVYQIESRDKVRAADAASK